MESVELMFIIAVFLFLIFSWRTVNPKMDWNYETGERLLWYNDPFDSCERKSIVIWKNKQYIFIKNQENNGILQVKKQLGFSH